MDWKMQYYYEDNSHQTDRSISQCNPYQKPSEVSFAENGKLILNARDTEYPKHEKTK